MSEQAESTESSNNKSSSKLTIILLITIVVLLLVVAGGIIMLFMKKNQPMVAPPVIAQNEARAGTTDAISASPKETLYYEIEKPFVVNFHNEGRTRYLKVKVELMSHQQKAIDIIQQHLPLIKNNLVVLFSAQTFSDLTTLEGKEKLREQALESIQKVVTEQTGEPGIDQVLFTSFVIQ